jgi:N utilization substance protein A
MSSPATLNQIIDQLSREKGIDASIIVSALEDAMLVATRKYYKSTEDLKAQFNKDNGSVKVFAIKKVVEEVLNPVKEVSMEEARKYNPSAEVDSEVLIPKATDVLGRIAAQTAKQVIFQKVREAERDTVFGEYSGRVGECVNCTVKRIEGPDLIVDLGKTEGRLPRKEQSRLESFELGERVRVVILKVDKAAKGPQVIVSRADATLVTRLFEMEVPEIYDSTVVIKACAREAGERTKIAVLSRDRDVDCVGACVGLKGMRVESIRRELRGEKIDIVEHSEDPVVFATHALSPAKISRVTVLAAATKHLEVIVDDTQLSLAIGKKGQNVRLAAKLMGWKIDIKSEEEKRQEVERQMSILVDTGTPLSELPGLSESVREKLTAAGVTSIEKLGEMTGDDLENIPGVGPKMVEKISASVQNYWEGGSEAAPAGSVAAGAETPGETAETKPEAAEGDAASKEAAVDTAVKPAESGGERRLDGAESESAEPPVSSSSSTEDSPQPEAPTSGHAEAEPAGSQSAEAEAAKEN